MEDFATSLILGKPLPAVDWGVWEGADCGGAEEVPFERPEAEEELVLVTICPLAVIFRLGSRFGCGGGWGDSIFGDVLPDARQRGVRLVMQLG